MNAEIRRQGIVIKTVPITSDRVRIGSGDACEIQLNDQFLAPIVAELVRHGSEWRIVDAGVSLEGVTRGGSRVMDEVLERGESYVVGAFELVIDPQLVPRPSLEQPRPDAGSLPMTMMEANLGVLPSTVVQSAFPAAKPDARQQGGNKLVFAPIEPPRGGPAPDPRRAPQPAPKRRPLLLVAAASITAICIALAVVMGGGSKKSSGKSAPAPAVTTQSAPAAAAVRGPSGDELAANLDIEKAFAAWEAEFAAKPSTELRDKIVSGAFELGRAYAAAHNAQTASRYFAKVERYGDPNSDIVRLARSRIGT